MQSIMELISSIKTNYDFFGQNVFPMTFVLIAFLYFLVKDRRKHINYFYLCIFIFLLWLNPFFANNWITFFLHSAGYFEFLLLIPAVALMAYAATDGMYRLEKSKRIFFCAAVVLLIQFGIRFAYTGDYIDLNLRNAKIDPEVVQILDKIQADGIDARTIAPDELASQMREYSLATDVFYQKGYTYNPDELKEMIKVAKSNKCNIIVLEKSYDDEERMEKSDFYYLMNTEHYVVYVKL